MNKFVRSFLTEWRRLELPFENETFVAAVSGGADSVSLMIVLKELCERKKLENRFIIAHFNHNLRGEESKKDAEYVKVLAEKFGFEFVAGISGDAFAIDAKGNLEQNARIARYGFLLETAEIHNSFAVLTAHTLNDQAETFLLNLIRGSGISGLSGMKAVSSNFRVPGSGLTERSQIPKPESRICLVRPLLNWARREDTENYCFENNIKVRLDSMNEDLGYQRVRIRKVLLPTLKAFNPQIVDVLARTAALMRAEGDAFEESSNRKREIRNQSLTLKELETLSKARLYQVLREWLKENRGNLRRLELKHIEAIERLIFSRKSGRVVELPDGETVVRTKGKIIFGPKIIL